MNSSVVVAEQPSARPSAPSADSHLALPGSRNGPAASYAAPPLDQAASSAGTVNAPQTFYPTSAASPPLRQPIGAAGNYQPRVPEENSPAIFYMSHPRHQQQQPPPLGAAYSAPPITRNWNARQQASRWPPQAADYYAPQEPLDSVNGEDDAPGGGRGDQSQSAANENAPSDETEEGGEENDDNDESAPPEGDLEERTGERAYSENQADATERDRHGRPVRVYQRHLVNGRPVSVSDKQQQADFESVVSEIDDQEDQQQQPSPGAASNDYDDAPDGQVVGALEESRSKRRMMPSDDGSRSSKVAAADAQIQASGKRPRLRRRLMPKETRKRRDGSVAAKYRKKAPKQHQHHRLSESLSAQQWDDDSTLDKSSAATARDQSGADDDVAADSDEDGGESGDISEAASESNSQLQEQQSLASADGDKTEVDTEQQEPATRSVTDDDNLETSQTAGDLFRNEEAERFPLDSSRQMQVRKKRALRDMVGEAQSSELFFLLLSSLMFPPAANGEDNKNNINNNKSKNDNNSRVKSSLDNRPPVNINSGSNSGLVSDTTRTPLARLKRQVSVSAAQPASWPQHPVSPYGQRIGYAADPHAPPTSMSNNQPPYDSYRSTIQPSQIASAANTQTGAFQVTITTDPQHHHHQSPPAAQVTVPLLPPTVQQQQQQPTNAVGQPATTPQVANGQQPASPVPGAAGLEQPSQVEINRLAHLGPRTQGSSTFIDERPAAPADRAPGAQVKASPAKKAAEWPPLEAEPPSHSDNHVAPARPKMHRVARRPLVSESKRREKKKVKSVKFKKSKISDSKHKAAKAHRSKMKKGAIKKKKHKARKKMVKKSKEFKGSQSGKKGQKGGGQQGSNKGAIYYKDRGFKKRGFKKAYRKVEAGDHKTYFDEFRDKDHKKKWKKYKDKHHYSQNKKWSGKEAKKYKNYDLNEHKDKKTGSGQWKEKADSNYRKDYKKKSSGGGLKKKKKRKRKQQHSHDE